MAWKATRKESDVRRTGITLEVDFATGRIIGPKDAPTSVQVAGSTGDQGLQRAIGADGDAGLGSR